MACCCCWSAWWFKHPRWDLTPPFQFTRRIAKHENMNTHSARAREHTKDNAGSYLTTSLITAAAGRLNYAQTCGKNIKLHHSAAQTLKTIAFISSSLYTHAPADMFYIKISTSVGPPFVHKLVRIHSSFEINTFLGFQKGDYAEKVAQRNWPGVYFSAYLSSAHCLRALVEPAAPYSCF